MTKAYFKDHSPEHALKFFEEGIQNYKQQKEAHEDYLVSLFDSTFGIDQSENPAVDIETFKQKYLNLILIREKQKKEVKAIHILEQIL